MNASYLSHLLRRDIAKHRRYALRTPGRFVA
jgi:hypothetical protein